MRTHRWAYLLALALAFGCSQPATAPDDARRGAPGPELSGSPSSEQPAGADGGQQTTENPTPETRANREQEILSFLNRYYEARTQGDRQAVEAMTDGPYRQRALATLQADTGIPVEVVRLEWWNSMPDDAEPSPTVVRKRAGKEGGVRFRLEPRGDSWVIVDLLDPATGRWLGDPAPRTATMPAALRAEMEAFVRKFYTEARSFTGGAQGVNFEKLYTYADGGYDIYLRNLLRKTTAQSERYQVTSIRLLSWMPADTPDHGIAEIEVARTLTRVMPDGKQTTETGTARLRVRYGVQPNDRVGWKVVDGFLAEENAWVTTLYWSGLLTAA
jgi:hypothetical protein